MSHVRIAAIGLAGTLLLAGCDSGDRAPRGVETDPAVSAALADRLMVDPEMAGEQGAALAADGGSVTVPPEDRSPEAVDAARAQALALAGGTLLALPPAVNVATGAADALTAVQVARDAGIGGPACAAKMQYSATWAAKLPAEFPVYPRGAVEEGAGSDGDGCAVRAVDFLTPVPPAEVAAFYYTRARKAGYAVDYRLADAVHLMTGGKGKAAFSIHVRNRGDGITQVDLVTGTK